MSLGDLYEKPEFNQQKFKQVLFFIYDYCYKHNKKLGKTRLQKILWFSEANHYENTGEYLFGGKFIKMQYGPYIEQANTLTHYNEQSGEIQTIGDTYKIPDDYEFNLLNEEQTRSIQTTINFVCSYLAKDISDMTHNLHWDITEIGGVLPIQTAFETSDENKLDDDDMMWALHEIEKHENNNADNTPTRD